MLKNLRFLLFEMLISISLMSLIVIGVTYFCYQLKQNTPQYYLTTHLQQVVQQTLTGLSKNIK